MIPSEELSEVVSYIEENGVEEETIANLRKRFSDRHFTLCTEDDISVGKPVVASRLFEVYLVNSADHCSKLTNDPDIASGYVIAELLD